MKLLLLLLLFVCTFGERITTQKAEELAKSSPEEPRKLVTRACPNSCSGNGVCTIDTCHCFFGYTGDDCSLEERQLISGVSQTGSVSTFNWKFYYLPLRSTSNLEVILNQTSGGDCDLYVQKDKIPTRNEYYDRDISTSPSVRLYLENLRAATWYFGVYGFLSCDFEVRVTAEGQCPNGCSGHGNCLGGNCVCDVGYAGADCSAAVRSLELDASPVRDAVATGLWNFYSFPFSPNAERNKLLVRMTQTSQGDCDLYARYGTPPEAFKYDFANVTTDRESTISITSPQGGLWFLGVHGFVGCEYDLSVTSSNDCPNKCSKRGQCEGTLCRCNAGYSGHYCQTRTALLTNGEEQSGYVEHNNWNYFTFRSNSANFAIDVTQQNGGDCDLFVKRDTVPSRVNFDYLDTGVNESFTLVIPDPGIADWHIGIYGWQLCSYSLRVRETSSCPSDCSGHGTCTSGGTCICEDGWTGEDCSRRLSQLENNKLSPVHTLTKGNWTYFTFPVNRASTVHLALVERSSEGYLWLYAGKEPPTLVSHDYSETSTNSRFHRISIDLSQGQIEDLQIGVYANPFTPAGRTLDYQIIAWAPSF